jgi:hypothetical protein
MKEDRKGVGGLYECGSGEGQVAVLVKNLGSIKRGKFDQIMK